VDLTGVYCFAYFVFSPLSGFLDVSLSLQFLFVSVSFSQWFFICAVLSCLSRNFSLSGFYFVVGLAVAG
jgi:hypothetical protein